jgi:hypothetical protein
MNLSNYFKAFSLISILTITSCDLINSTQEPDKISTQPAFNSSYSVLWALNTVTTINTGNLGIDIGDTQVEVGTAFAAFVDGAKYTPAGVVKVNDNVLKMQSNNAYISEVSLTNPSGIMFSGNVKWIVEGASNVSAINYTVSKQFPTATGLEADATVDKSVSYTISLNSVTGADSILFAVNDLIKTVGGSVKSITFTPEQLAKLKKGPAFVQVAPYNYVIKKYGTKDCVFGNQIVLSKLVTIK